MLEEDIFDEHDSNFKFNRDNKFQAMFRRKSGKRNQKYSHGHLNNSSKAEAPGDLYENASSMSALSKIDERLDSPEHRNSGKRHRLNRKLNKLKRNSKKKMQIAQNELFPDANHENLREEHDHA